MGLERQDSSGGKFKEIDYKLKEIDRQLKEPALVALTKHDVRKVANLAGNFTKDKTEDSQSRTVDKPAPAVSDYLNWLMVEFHSTIYFFCQCYI